MWYIVFKVLKKDTERRSLEQIMQAISDTKSYDIFWSISKGNGKNDALKRTKGLTVKEYYTITRRLTNAGLVLRVKGNFSLTSLGVVVYNSQTIVKAGLDNYWKLKAIDSIQSSGQMEKNERIKLVKALIQDDTIEGILAK